MTQVTKTGSVNVLGPGRGQGIYSVIGRLLGVAPIIRKAGSSTVAAVIAARFAENVGTNTWNEAARSDQSKGLPYLRVALSA